MLRKPLGSPEPLIGICHVLVFEILPGVCRGVCSFLWYLDKMDYIKWRTNVEKL